MTLYTRCDHFGCDKTTDDFRFADGGSAVGAWKEYTIVGRLYTGEPDPPHRTFHRCPLHAVTWNYIAEGISAR